jgi:hypothetical protein
LPESDGGRPRGRVRDEIRDYVGGDTAMKLKKNVLVLCEWLRDPDAKDNQGAGQGRGARPTEGR